MNLKTLTTITLTVLLMTYASVTYAADKVFVKKFKNNGDVTEVLKSAVEKAGLSIVDESEAQVIVSGTVIKSKKKVSVAAKIKRKSPKKVLGEHAQGKNAKDAARKLTKKVIKAIKKL